MKRIAFVGTVGAGKTTLFNALQGNYSLARKTQAVEFNENGDIDTPGEYFSHPRWYHALITTLQDVDTLIYIHAANDKESRLPAGLLDIGASKRQIAVISKTDMPDADVAATRQLLRGMGFQEPIFELNSHDPRSVQHLVDYLTELSQKEERAGEKNSSQLTIFVRPTHAANRKCRLFCAPASSPRRRAKLRSCWALPSVNAMNPRQEPSLLLRQR